MDRKEGVSLMSMFGKESYNGKTEVKEGRVTSLKNSHKKGHRQVMVRSKQAPQKAFTVDVPYKEAKSIQRKKDYSFNVYEDADNQDRFGGEFKRESPGRIKSYMTDEAPSEYTGRYKPQFKSFGSDDGENSGRLKF